MQDNLNAYVRGEIKAGVRRILFTRWVGQAWDEVSSDEEMVVRSFRKVGIALPIDGSEDKDEINITGLEDYVITEEDSDGDDESEEGEGDEDEGSEEGEGDEDGGSERLLKTHLHHAVTLIKPKYAKC